MPSSEDRGDADWIQLSSGVVRLDQQLGARNVLCLHPLVPGSCADHDSSRPRGIRGAFLEQGIEAPIKGNKKHPQVMTAVEHDVLLGKALLLFVAVRFGWG